MPTPTRLLRSCSWSIAASALLVACASGPDPDTLRDRRARIDAPRRSLSLHLAGDRPEAPNAGAERTERAAPTVAEVRERADLDTWMRYGLHHNQRLRASYARFEAAVERVAQSDSLPDPMMTFAQFVEDLQTRTGAQVRRYSLTQALPWFGELRQRRHVASAEVDEAWQHVVHQRLTVEREIAEHFAEYAYLSHAVRIGEQTLDLLRQLDATLQSRIAAGRSTQADLLRLQVEIGRVENELQSLRAVQPSMSARLASALDLDSAAVGALPLPELHEPTLRPLDRASLRERALRASPELLRLQARVRTAVQRRELVDYDSWPDLQIGVDYFETDGALQPTPGSGDDPWALRVGFSLPLWRGRYRAHEREAEHAVRAAEAEFAQRRNELLADVEAAAFALEDAARQVELYRDTLLPRAREALSVVRTAYTAGSLDLLAVIDSERALLQFETAYWRACRDHHKSEARLEALMGGTPR